MDKYERLFIETFVEFYSIMGKEEMTEELMKKYRYTGYNDDNWNPSGFGRYLRSLGDTVNLSEVTFESISDEDKIKYKLPEEKIIIQLDIWEVAVNRLVDRLIDVESKLKPLCNENSKVNYNCYSGPGGIELSVFIYREDIPEGKTTRSNKYYREASRIALEEFFRYAKALKAEFDSYQKGVKGAQTFAIEKPEEDPESTTVGVFISIPANRVHGFGKGSDPDSTLFNKHLRNREFGAEFDLYRDVVTN